LAKALKKIYRTDTQEEAEEAWRSLQERWGVVYPKIVERWETKAYALLACRLILSPFVATSTPPTTRSS